MPLNPCLTGLEHEPKVLLLGSGGLAIGQAGEFDYSGTQAIKALKEEGCHVILVNPNIATVQTNPQDGVTVYLYPVEREWVEKVIAKERPQAVVAGFGGQTALNCLIDLEDSGVLAKYDVTNLGTPADVLRLTEDRDAFANKMLSIGKPIPPSRACSTWGEAARAAAEIGYPVIARAAYALGGLGSGFADNEGELEAIVTSALASSPQVLVEKSLRGFKEVEYEVMRDAQGNTITICNMENFDPLGVHTGDSIVVAPSQTLSDDEYQILRNAAIDIINELGVVGECNIQYALHPESKEYFIIEVNARLSRSSALASKATGYPIAYIAAKVVAGFDLLELKNPVTGVTSAFFEPAMDYLALKIPRWDLRKFTGVNCQLGSTMKSVGEVMSIGRNFPEIIQKAVRMVTEDAVGLSRMSSAVDAVVMREQLANPTDTRLFWVIEALREGFSVEEIHEISAIDKWFLSQLQLVVNTENKICSQRVGVPGGQSKSDFESFLLASLAKVSGEDLRQWKLRGFGDEQIAYLLVKGFEAQGKLIQDLSLLVRKLRLEYGIKPVVKKIDTTAGEYPSPSNYLYMSYAGSFDDVLPDDGKAQRALVLGGGTYRIGASVEFDWCAVSCSQRLKESGWRSVMINCNPETVSTDYNSSDHLFFEELSLERILDIAAFEETTNLVACMGGQQPNRLALPLAQAGMVLMGHAPETIDTAEDRSKFSALLDRLGIDQPKWIAATSKEDVDRFLKKYGFPVLIRPSYVLSGAAMQVAYNEDSLAECLANANHVSPDYPIVISEFVEGAREIELDGVAQNGKILTGIVTEHIENAGVHSGDATTVVPAQNLYVETVRRIRKAGRKIAESLNLNGPFNIQFLAKEGGIKVIECNARAARSFPFVSKTVRLNLADVATKVIMGDQPDVIRLNEDDLPYVGVKAAMFSFARLAGADPLLGVEMAATGEVGCIGNNLEEALLLALQSTGNRRPSKAVLVSSGGEKNKLAFLKSAERLREMGLPIYGTEGTARYLQEHGFDVQALAWPGQGDDDVINAIKSGLVDFVINIPKDSQRQELTRGAQIRQAAIKYNCTLLTNMEKVVAFIKAAHESREFVRNHEPLALRPFWRRDADG